MKFFAAEAWTDAAQGTYISFATTPKGSNNYVNGVPGAAPERLRITDAGWVGIGTTAPGAMLEVNGTAQFDGLVTFAAGQTFPGAILASACAAGCHWGDSSRRDLRNDRGGRNGCERCCY